MARQRSEQRATTSADAAGVPRTPVAEARMVETEAGRKPADDGWFVLNLADAAGAGTGEDEYHFAFERAHRAFPHFGINVTVLRPGGPGAMYHAEPGQEAFLVLEGECVLIVEDQERRLRRWDFFHCPPWTAHVLVGAGDGPCAVLMVGARNAGRAGVYPPSAAAARYGAAVEHETRDSRAAYAGWPALTERRYPWPPGQGSGLRM
jgi:uncharacterized cupin superfamily protein